MHAVDAAQTTSTANNNNNNNNMLVGPLTWWLVTAPVAAINLSMITICSCARYYLPGELLLLSPWYLSMTTGLKVAHNSEGCWANWPTVAPGKNWKYPNLVTITLARVCRKKLKIVKFVNPTWPVWRLPTLLLMLDNSHCYHTLTGPC